MKIFVVKFIKVRKSWFTRQGSSSWNIDMILCSLKLHIFWKDKYFEGTCPSCILLHVFERPHTYWLTYLFSFYLIFAESLLRTFNPLIIIIESSFVWLCVVLDFYSKLCSNDCTFPGKWIRDNTNATYRSCT